MHPCVSYIGGGDDDDDKGSVGCGGVVVGDEYEGGGDVDVVMVLVDDEDDHGRGGDAWYQLVVDVGGSQRSGGRRWPESHRWWSPKNRREKWGLGLFAPSTIDLSNSSMRSSNTLNLKVMDLIPIGGDKTWSPEHGRSWVAWSRWYEGGGDVDVVMVLVDGGDDHGRGGDAWCRLVIDIGGSQRSGGWRWPESSRWWSPKNRRENGG
uniref:Uncharacterized protein n=1 Tax=Tanacetum cinerariifolium TaxID=118510 RepID=A0A6L2LX26_TANCI|nr:hypothetical protein [Tanacetum cinerariifolium]